MERFKKTLSELKYILIQNYHFYKADTLLVKTFEKKECYFGPFVGEFGHLMGHIVPFISFLHYNNIKINFIGPGIHKTFFYDEKNKLIVKKYIELRDFYSEITPNCNNQNVPNDIEKKIIEFKIEAKKSNLPFWDISSRNFYWIGFCKWMYRRKYFKIYKRKKKLVKQQIAIFAIKKGSPTNFRGDDWDFQKIIDQILIKTNYEIKILGHPAFSYNFKNKKRVKKILTSDNNLILRECLESKFIINQMSGSHYFGLYSETPVLLLMKGNNVDFSDYIKDLNYRLMLDSNSNIYLCKSIDEIFKFLKK